jgi:hypothetical protein
MADIDVVKKRTTVWPWVIGIILLILIVWLLMSVMGGPPAASRTGLLVIERAASAA